MKPLFVTGIDTGVGKTVISAILTEYLQADYWKPVQSGDLLSSDTDQVKKLVSNAKSIFHPESYRLSQPFSPHKSASLDGIRIEPDKIVLPSCTNRLIIEGAGGLMVPLNDKDMIIDLIRKFNAEVILVSKNYLGSINHTLLSVEILKTKNIPLRGIVFNGEPESYSEELILSYTGIRRYARIPQVNILNKQSVANLGKELKNLDLINSK